MKRGVCLFLICVLLCLSGCTREVSTQLFAMDTVMQLQFWGKDAEKASETIQAGIRQNERTWTVAAVNTALKAMEKGEPVAYQYQQRAIRALEIKARTSGAFDPQLGAAVAAWGFYDKNYTVPSQKTLDKALAEKNWDLGGMIKGYTADQCVLALEKLDIDRALLNLGGNIQTYGSKPGGEPWRIGIQNPDGGDYLGVVSVEGTMAVVTSGDYQRYFEKDGVRYHHILDPQTGMPANSGLRSVTVICREGLTADALSTALFVMGLEKAGDFWRRSDDFEAVFVTAKGEIYATEGAALSGCEYEVIRHEN